MPKNKPKTPKPSTGTAGQRPSTPEPLSIACYHNEKCREIRLEGNIAKIKGGDYLKVADELMLVTDILPRRGSVWVIRAIQSEPAPLMQGEPVTKWDPGQAQDDKNLNSGD